MVAFCALFSLAVACRSIHSIVLRFTPDDAYYYMRVAQNIGAGLGSRFDSLNTTNGYHPLWLAVISPVYFLVRDHLMEPFFLFKVHRLLVAKIFIEAVCN